MRKLFQDNRTIIEETGANSLFLAMGFLEWSDTEEGLVDYQYSLEGLVA